MQYINIAMEKLISSMSYENLSFDPGHTLIRVNGIYYDADRYNILYKYIPYEYVYDTQVNFTDDLLFILRSEFDKYASTLNKQNIQLLKGTVKLIQSRFELFKMCIEKTKNYKRFELNFLIFRAEMLSTIAQLNRDLDALSPSD